MNILGRPNLFVDLIDGCFTILKISEQEDSTPQIEIHEARYRQEDRQCQAEARTRRHSSKTGFHRIRQTSQGIWRSTKLHESNANKDLGQPIRYLFEIRVSSIPGCC